VHVRHKEFIVLKKLIAPLVIGGVLLGGVASAGVAAAATPAATASAAAPTHAGKHALRAWLRAHRRELRRDGIAISAKTIGVTPKALVAELRSGQSIAAVAGAHGVSAQTVVNALSSAADTKIGQAVTDHKLTSAQAATIEAALPGYLTKAVNHTFK
jgi:transposase-like protein